MQKAGFKLVTAIWWHWFLTLISFGVARTPRFIMPAPPAWHDGWTFDRANHCAAQYTMQKAGNTFTTTKWRPRYSTNRAEWRPIWGFRDTFSDERVRNTTWVPGSGAHRTRSEFPMNLTDEVDDNCHAKETAPRNKFSKVKPDRLERDPHKIPRKPSSMMTPGPGSYRQACYLGGDNSGTRRLAKTASTGFIFKT